MDLEKIPLSIEAKKHLDNTFFPRARDTAKDVKKTILTILVWGASEESHSLYFKMRLMICNELRKENHAALFSEDIKEDFTSNVKINEYIQAGNADYIILIPSSPGSVAELHDFVVYRSIVSKMLILMDKKFNNGYSSKGELVLVEKKGAEVVWFDNNELGERCLIDKVLRIVQKVQYAKFMQDELNKNW